MPRVPRGRGQRRRPGGGGVGGTSGAQGHRHDALLLVAAAAAAAAAVEEPEADHNLGPAPGVVRGEGRGLPAGSAALTHGELPHRRARAACPDVLEGQGACPSSFALLGSSPCSRRRSPLQGLVLRERLCDTQERLAMQACNQGGFHHALGALRCRLAPNRSRDQPERENVGQGRRQGVVRDQQAVGPAARPAEGERLGAAAGGGGVGAAQREPSSLRAGRTAAAHFGGEAGPRGEAQGQPSEPQEARGEEVAALEDLLHRRVGEAQLPVRPAAAPEAAGAEAPAGELHEGRGRVRLRILGRVGFGRTVLPQLPVAAWRRGQPVFRHCH
mmetsp:Transcript_30885/g.98505  ORF Transcript_30885/g.98505 Transcript_30885/m.98505 type:complete len:329 (+) Transcript_30885:247-1233(+)